MNKPCKPLKEYIILTSGFAMNPAILRFGIEVTSDTLYYCEEIKAGSGKYAYYSGITKYDKFIHMKQRINKEFKSYKSNENRIVDAQPYEMVYELDNYRDSVILYINHITDEQASIIDEIIAMKNRKLKKIAYHTFPEKLLKYKLPPPPKL